MRRLFGVLLLCTSIALVGAVAPTAPGATPTPLPLLTPEPTPSAGAGTPVVVVYPFDVQGGLDPKIGLAMAQITTDAISSSGGLTMMAVPTGVTRANFLETARTMHADYYISGYVTPVGEMASVVEQLVTVSSGIIIYSQTAEITGVADVASQALVQRDAILAHSGLGERQTVAKSNGTPEPTATNGANVKLSGLNSIVDSVFGHKGKPSASPSPIVKPDRGVIVPRVTAGANAPAIDLTTATNSLYFALNKYFNVQMTALAGQVAQNADAMCGTNRDNTIAAGTLSQTHVSGNKGKMEPTFTLDVYTCFGVKLDEELGKAATPAAAITAAVAAYVAAHPQNS